MIQIDPGVFAFNEDLQVSNENFIVTGAGDPSRVVAALQRAAERFMRVDENGVEHPDEESAVAALEAGLYTPNYVADPIVTDAGVEGYIDCKSSIEEPMAQKLRGILWEELEAVGIDGRVVAAEWSS